MLPCLSIQNVGCVFLFRSHCATHVYVVHDGCELGVLLVGAVDEVDGAVKVLHIPEGTDFHISSI